MFLLIALQHCPPGRELRGDPRARRKTLGQYKVRTRVRSVLVIGRHGSNRVSHCRWLRSVERLGVDSSSLLVEGDASGALLFGDANLLQSVGGHGGDDRGLSAVAVLVSGEGDLDNVAVIEGIPVEAEGGVKHET